MKQQWRAGVVGIAVLGVLGAGIGAAVARTDHHGAGHVPTYATARAMATRVDCLSSFHEVPAPPGVTSAGECRVLGSVVRFRVQPRINDANPWPVPRRDRPAPTYVSRTWMMQSRGLLAFATAGARLDP